MEIKIIELIVGVFIITLGFLQHWIVGITMILMVGLIHLIISLIHLIISLFINKAKLEVKN